MAPSGELAALDDRLCNSLGGGLIQPVALARYCDAATAKVQVNGYVIWRQQAIAVGEQEILGLGYRYPFVAALGNAEAVVRMSGELDRELGPPGKLLHHLAGLVARAIVGHHQFHLAFDPPLTGNRGQ